MSNRDLVEQAQLLMREIRRLRAGRERRGLARIPQKRSPDADWISLFHQAYIKNRKEMMRRGMAI